MLVQFDLSKINPPLSLSLDLSQRMYVDADDQIISAYLFLSAHKKTRERESKRCEEERYLIVVIGLFLSTNIDRNSEETD